MDESTTDYIGVDFIYLSFTTIIYIVGIFLFEYYTTMKSSKQQDISSYELTSGISDEEVKKEIERANNFRTEDTDKASKEFLSVRVQNLEKYYSSGMPCENKPDKKAVDKLSLCLKYGECFALLGVNGAGKTTTFKCLTNEVSPSSGSIYINGLDITSNFTEIRNLIGYCPQFDAIFELLTVHENLEFYANIKGVTNDKIEPVIDSLMEELNLTQYRDKLSGKLSGGNKRKLSVAIAMIGNPPIILLDEPSTGMDPESRKFMWSVIHKISIKRKQSSVILTTHSMEEAESLCRRIGIMVNGQFQCLGTSQQIKEKYGTGYEIPIRIANIPEEQLKEQIGSLRLNYEDNIKFDLVNTILDKFQKTETLSQYLTENDNLGSELFNEVNIINLLTYKLINLLTYGLD